MAIDVTCAECGRSYRMKDERAGSRVRCKDCQSIMHVPDEAAGEEWDDQENPWETAEEPPALPARRRSGTTARAAAPKKGASAGGSPVMKILGGLAFAIAAAMIVGIVVSVANGNVRTLRGAWLPIIFCGVGYKWIFGEKE